MVVQLKKKLKKKKRRRRRRRRRRGVSHAKRQIFSDTCPMFSFSVCIRTRCRWAFRFAPL